MLAISLSSFGCFLDSDSLEFRGCPCEESHEESVMLVRSVVSTSLSVAKTCSAS
jgi:hypothetical protein